MASDKDVKFNMKGQGMPRMSSPFRKSMFKSRDTSFVFAEGDTKGIQCLTSPRQRRLSAPSILNAPKFSREEDLTKQTIERYLKLDSTLSKKAIAEIIDMVQDMSLSNIMVVRKLRPYFVDNVILWQGLSVYIMRCIDPLSTRYSMNDPSQRISFGTDTYSFSSQSSSADSKNAAQADKKNDQSSNSSNVPGAVEDLNKNLSRLVEGSDSSSSESESESDTNSDTEKEKEKTGKEPVKSLRKTLKKRLKKESSLKIISSSFDAAIQKRGKQLLSKFADIGHKVMLGVAVIREIVKVVTEMRMSLSGDLDMDTEEEMFLGYIFGAINSPPSSGATTPVGVSSEKDASDDPEKLDAPGLALKMRMLFGKEKPAVEGAIRSVLISQGMVDENLVVTRSRRNSFQEGQSCEEGLRSAMRSRRSSFQEGQSGEEVLRSSGISQGMVNENLVITRSKRSSYQESGEEGLKSAAAALRKFKSGEEEGFTSPDTAGERDETQEGTSFFNPKLILNDDEEENLDEPTLLWLKESEDELFSVASYGKTFSNPELFFNADKTEAIAIPAVSSREKLYDEKGRRVICIPGKCLEWETMLDEAGNEVVNLMKCPIPESMLNNYGKEVVKSMKTAIAPLMLDEDGNEITDPVPTLSMDGFGNLGKGSSLTEKELEELKYQQLQARIKFHREYRAPLKVSSYAEHISSKSPTEMAFVPAFRDPKQETKTYLEEHGIHQLFEMFLNNLVLEQPNKPIDYLITLVRNIRICQDKETAINMNMARQKQPVTLNCDGS